MPPSSGTGTVESGRFDRWRHRFSLAVAVSGALLLGAGGLVTSTGSGLAVPDWPLSFGKLFPPMVGGVLFEHGHRMIAATVGLLTIGLAVWFALRERRPAVRRLAYVALAVVVVQGLLGGLTVILRLPLAVSVVHACLAQIFFCILVLLALLTSRRYLESSGPQRPPAGGPSLRRPAWGVSGLIFLQLLLGALMRHSGAGLAIPDVPLAFGRVVPPMFTGDIALHFAHRLGAVGIAVAVAWVAIRAVRLKRRDLVAPAALAVALVVLQIVLGATAVLTRLAVVPTTAHLVVGALLLATLMVVALRAGRSVVGEKLENRPIEALGEPA